MPTKKSTPAKKKETPESKKNLMDNLKTATLKVSVETLKAVSEENEILRQKLAAYEYPKDPQPMAINKPAPMSTMLTQFCEQMDGQLSRLYNSINTLEATTDRLQFAKKDGSIAEGTMPQDADLNTRLGRLLDHLSYQNSRFEDLNAKLNNLI